MKSFALLCTIILATAAMLSMPAFGADYAGDFSITNGNPNGNWTYGYTAALAPGYTLTNYTATTTSVSGTAGLYGWVGNLGGFGTPLAEYNSTGALLTSGTAQFPPNTAALHPGQGGQVSIARYTLPDSTTYAVSVVFTGFDATTTDVHVLLNGTSLFNSAVTGRGLSTAYSGNLALSAGDRLDLAVGVGSDGSYLDDTTGVAATITALPEPGSLALMALVAPALLARRRGMRSRR